MTDRRQQVADALSRAGIRPDTDTSAALMTLAAQGLARAGLGRDSVLALAGLAYRESQSERSGGRTIGAA